ncbi:hypothetical protein MTBBW1_2410006 [Desulfamplus magnetovallimortis]|uniref:Uncharacterized protein n=1 Tax=Desulfamplus magnetovallimortis TaxID=1246637 RepID=A0A1W1HEH1_9BACT|nr:hypothetical protein MTBBW1_2410006 [Desulfamplus magnetovallimortis]
MKARDFEVKALYKRTLTSQLKLNYPGVAVNYEDNIRGSITQEDSPAKT